MPIYEFTTEGQRIAEEAGLVDLADKLSEAEYVNTLILNLVDGMSWDSDPIDTEENAIAKTRKQLKSREDRIAMERGLLIVPDVDFWRQAGGLAEDTLFPAEQFNRFMPSTYEDSLVLSSVVGMQLRNYSRSCRLLAKNGYQEFGFDNFTQSCAFVGAYVLSAMCKDQEKSIRNFPSFTYLNEGINHKISVGGTIHGDFRMIETKTMWAGIISPVNTQTEYGPEEFNFASGYHSTERGIVEAIITDEYIKNGKEGTAKLIDELLGTAARHLNKDGDIGFRIGDFGDYGDDSSEYMDLIRLEHMIENPEYRNRLTDLSTLESSIYAPQSDTMFEIVSEENGIKFQNRDSNSNATSAGIYVSRENYKSLFNCLLLQTRAGLGRTAPHQLINLLLKAKALLEVS